MSNSNYQSWLERQREIAELGLLLIQKYKLDATVITDPIFIRVFLSDKTLDFYLKSIKSQFSKTVWLCKQKDFNPQKNYLVYLKKEKKFLVASGKDVDEESEIKRSDWGKKSKMIVVPIDVFGPANGYFKSISKFYEGKKQKRLINWT